jgi:hypothetical protein
MRAPMWLPAFVQSPVSTSKRSPTRPIGERRFQVSTSARLAFS